VGIQIVGAPNRDVVTLRGRVDAGGGVRRVDAAGEAVELKRSSAP
jgi:hypothetical protein